MNNPPFTSESMYQETLQNHKDFIDLMAEKDVTIAHSFTRPDLISARTKVLENLEFIQLFEFEYTKERKRLLQTLRMNYKQMEDYAPKD